MAQPKEIQINVQPRSDRLPAAESANYFKLSFVSGEVQLLLGAVNLDDIHHLVEKAKLGDLPSVADNEHTIHVDVSHRLLLSRFAFDQLKKSVDDLDRQLKEAEAKGTKP